MATLDEEWLGGDDKPVEQRLEECQVDPITFRVPSRELTMEAAGEIRALRLLVKNQSKRIDELMDEIEGYGRYGEDL